MPDIWDTVATQLQQEALSQQATPPDVWEQVAADMPEQPQQRIPEVSLRGPAPIVTDFPQEGQPQQPLPEVSLPPIQREPTAFPPIQMPAPEPEALPPDRAPSELPPYAEPRSALANIDQIPGVTPVEGPPSVEPPYEAPPMPEIPSMGDRVDAAANAFAQTLQQQVGPIASGAAGMAGMRYGGAPSGEMFQPMPGQTYASTMQAVQRDPLVQGAQAVSAQAEKDIPVPPWAEQTLPVQIARGAAQFVPMVGAGMVPGVGPLLAPAVARLQTIGHEMEHGYKARVDAGMPAETAARETFNKANKAGISAQIIWTVAPGPMKKAADKFLIDKVGEGVAKRFIAGRAAAAAEGYGLGYSSQVAQNIATGRPRTEGAHEAGKGLAFANLLMPHGPTAKEVAAARASLPGEARQAVRGAVIRPTRRPTAEHQKAKERAKETSARAGHDIAKSNYERVLTNKSSRETNGARFRANVPKAFQSRSDVQQIKNAIVFMRDNLLKAARAALKEPWAKFAAKQYEGYNKYSHYLADLFNGRWKPETVMVTESAESPNTSPDNSFEATRRLMKMLSQNSEDVFDERMADWARNRTGKNSAGETVHLYDPADIDFLLGQKFSQVPQVFDMQAKWLRAFDEVYHPDKTLRVVRPDGTLGDTVKTSTGADMPFAWTPFKMIQNGVDALLEQRPVEEILHSPKVANYYMSKLLAFERSDHVVADTHHTSAAWGNSLPADHELISKVFKSGRDVKNDEFAGYYSIVHEATIQAAKKLGMDPKEFQALVWSYQRGFKSPDVLGPGLAEVIQGLWKNAAQGRITGKEAYDGTTEIANNFHGGQVPAPDYFGGRFRSADAPPEGTSGKPAELPQGGGVPESAVRGGGIPDAGGVARRSGIAKEFFSSSTKHANLVDSPEHRKALAISEDIARQLDHAGPSFSGVADTEGWGAEDSVMHSISNARNFDEVRYAAAIKGKLLEQKAVLAFMSDPQGADAVHSLVVPTRDSEAILKNLNEEGLPNRTLLPHGKGTRIVIFDEGNKLADNVDKLADKYGIQEFKTEPGRGEFVGNSDTVEGAARNYDAIRADYEARYPTSNHYADRPSLYYDRLASPEKGTLSERAARLQPKSEAGSVGGSGGEERPEERERGPVITGLPARSDQTVVHIPVEKFDPKWAEERGSYLEPGGTGENYIGKRYQSAKELVASGKPIKAPDVSVWEDGTIRFSDGRHRYAAMRDAGVKDIPISLDAESLANARKTGLIPGEKPVTFYHGQGQRGLTVDELNPPVYFSPDKEFSRAYEEQNGIFREPSGHSLNLKNPKIVHITEEQVRSGAHEMGAVESSYIDEARMRRYQQQGYDGVISKLPDGTVYEAAVFDRGAIQRHKWTEQQVSAELERQFQYHRGSPRYDQARHKADYENLVKESGWTKNEISALSDKEFDQGVRRAREQQVTPAQTVFQKTPDGHFKVVVDGKPVGDILRAGGWGTGGRGYDGSVMLKGKTFRTSSTILADVKHDIKNYVDKTQAQPDAVSTLPPGETGLTWAPEGEGKFNVFEDNVHTKVEQDPDGNVRLRGVVVNQGKRGKGAGRDFVEKLVADAAQQFPNAREAVVWAFPPEQGFWEKVGFNRTGRTAEAGEIGPIAELRRPLAEERGIGPVYHGSAFKFSEFKPGSNGIHFGTEDLAHEVHGRNVVEAYLDIKNPAKVKDQGSDWSLAIRRAKGDGHDGITYLNRFEGVDATTHDIENLSDIQFKAKYPGATESYIAFHPDQIRTQPGAGSLSERARRLQPGSESGAVGASGGEVGELPEEQKARAFGVRLQDDQRLLQELKDNLGNKDYTPIPNNLTAQQAVDLVDGRPVTDVINGIKDESNGLQFHIRSTMGQLVIQKLNDGAATLKAVGDLQGSKQLLDQAINMSEWAMEYGTRLGQGVQSFAMWNRLTPEGKLQSVQRLVKNTRSEFAKRNGENVSKIVDNVKEAASPEAKVDKMVAKQQDKIARQLSDTPTWAGATPVRKNEILELIRAHLKERQEAFVDKMDTFGVSRPLTESIDRMATENRRRIEAIAQTKEARDRAKRIDAAADQIAKQLSDTPTFAQRGQPDLAKALIKAHLKKPQADFVKRLVELGADENTAYTIDRLSIENRDRIQKIDRAKRAEELRKQNTPGNKVAKKLGKSEWEKIVELADHGLLTEKTFMDAAAERLGLPHLTQDAQAHILELAGKVRDATAGTPQDLAKQDLARFIKSKMGYKIADIPTGVYYSNMLSGYNTHLVNLIDTAFNVFAEINNMALANPRSAARVWGGGLKGFGEGFNDFWVALSAGRQLTNSKWLEVPDIMEVARFGEKGGVPPISPGTRTGRIMQRLAESKLAYPLRGAKYVGRLMSASDALMYRTAHEARASLIADRVAREEGLKGRELDKRVQELLGRSTDQEAAAWDQATSEGFTGAQRRVRAMELRSQVRGMDANADATEFAGWTTYNHQPRGWLGHFSNSIDRAFAPLPLLRAVIIPFTKIVANVTNRKLDYFPVVGHMRAIRGYYGDEATPQGDERAALMMRANMGTMALAGLGAAQYAGLLNIHGSGPSDTKKRKQLIETGWKPYTLEVGGRYYSYMTTPPGLMISTLGNVIDTYRYDELNKKDPVIRSAYVVSQIPITVFNQSFLNSLSTLFDALSQTDPERSIFAMKKFASGIVGTATTPRLALDVQRIFDPKMYQGDTIQGVLLQNTPFASLVNRPVLNAFGEPVKPPSNRFISAVTKDMAWQTVIKAQLLVPLPNKATKMPDGHGKDRDITPAEYYELVRQSGPKIRDWVVKNTPVLLRLKDKGEMYQKPIQEELSKFAEDTRAVILAKQRAYALHHPVD